VGASESTFVTQWPTGESRPFTATLNLAPGAISPNLVIAKVGAGGKVSLFNNTGSVDLVADVVGWFPTGAPGPGAPHFAGDPGGQAHIAATDGSTALRLVPDSLVLAPGATGLVRVIENDAS